MEYLQMTMDDYIQSKNEIKKDMVGIVKSFVRIGWLLTRIDRSAAYKMDGYSTITEFAKAEYNMTASGVSRFMDVYERYSENGDTPELKEQYRAFNFSQLTEMLQLTDQEHEMFRPEVKRETIRDFKAFQKENDADPDRLFNWNVDAGDLLGKTIVEYFRENREKMNELFASSAYLDGNIKEMVEILNPSGNGHFRHKTFFMVFYEAERGIMTNEFAKPPESISWQTFADKVREIFGDGAGSRTWETYFKGTENPEEEQVPGQDSIMNHPEYMPEPENAQNKPENAQNEPESVQNEQESDQKPEESVQEPPKVHEPVPEEIGPERLIAPAQKSPQTEEQKYDAEQRRIDRETKKKLQEMEDEEKMQHLPSDAGQQVHTIRMASANWDDIVSGRKAFEIRKKDHEFRVGHGLQMLEFHEGVHTGRRIDAEITYVLEKHSGLVDGFVILGFIVTNYHG